MTACRYSNYNRPMSFRAKISLVIFFVALLPTLAVLLFSTYLLSSTLNRVGAGGFEGSLQASDSLIEQTQETLGRFLIANMPDDSKAWGKLGDIDTWRKSNDVDLAFILSGDSLYLSLSDSIPRSSFTFQNLQSRSESALLENSRLEIGERCLLIFFKKPASFNGGCGILMPPGYSQRGRQLASSISASASLEIYKAFSLKLVAVATAGCIGIALLLGIVLSTSISRQLAGPLEKLSHGAKIIGTGNFDYRVSLGRHDDEFTQLANSFNRMAAEIKDNQCKLLESERLAAWREVARRIAHEIKNPLTPIGIEIFRLQEKLKSDPKFGTTDEALHSLAMIRSQFDTLGDLAQHFSTFAKEPDLKRLQCSLKNIIKDSVHIFSAEQNHVITTDIQNDIPLLNLDPQMMKRALVNLIKNSFEASPAGAKISISCSFSENIVKLMLRDNGPGFPLEKLERIDQPYITSKRTGTGLGLVIVKKIIEEHGGQIRFYNDSGAVTEINLPL